jgi:hypothetical protein
MTETQKEPEAKLCAAQSANTHSENTAETHSLSHYSLQQF